MEYGNATVLIVDDDVSYVEIVEAVILKSEPNVSLLKAYTGSKALELIHQHKLDLIISDISLPDMNGYDLCLTVKEDPQLHHIPIMIITGISRDSKLKVKLLEAGAEAFLEKPFGHSEFIAHIRSLLRLKKAEDSVRKERDYFKEEVLVKETSLSEQEERMSLILNNIIEGVWDWDFRKNTIFLSNKCKTMLGYKDSDLIDDSVESFLSLICPLDRERFRKEIDDYLKGYTPVFKSEVRMCYADGSYRWFLYHGYALWDDDNKPLRILGVQSDITESKENIRSLEKMALEDYVTRLPNRVLFHKMVYKELRSSKREKTVLGFLFIDLDNFKPINDNFGHHIGDKLLRAFGERLTESLRPLDIVARFAGDEFVASLTKVKDVGQIAIIVKRLRRVMQPPFSVDGNEFIVEFSAGYSLYPDDGDDIDELLKIADKRMYEDKKKRKGIESS